MEMRNEHTCVMPPVPPWPAASPRPTGSWGTDTHATGITACVLWGTKWRRGCGIARTWVSAATSVRHRHLRGRHAPTSPSRAAYSFLGEKEKRGKVQISCHFTYTNFYKLNILSIEMEAYPFPYAQYLERKPQISVGNGLYGASESICLWWRCNSPVHN